MKARRAYVRTAGALALSLILILGTVTANAATGAGSLSFSNTPLLRPEGDSEPAISIAANGTMALTGLQWLFTNSFGTHLWTGPFGSTPTFQGLLDSDLEHAGKQVFGSGDADVDLGSTGTLHATSLIFLINPAFNRGQLGVSAITCPNGASVSFSISTCQKKIIDTAGADRQWITSDGAHVWISYHDAQNSSLIHVQRSDDDGYTWKSVGDPIVGQDGATGDATFNNTQGPIVADPHTHNVYDIYAAGEPGIQKGTTATFNNIYVSRSTDLGKKWTANLVYHAPLFTDFSNVFPSLAVDPTNGKLYAVWSDGHVIYFSASSDQGSHWSASVTVNIAPASTALFPWIAAYNGTVDVVYYGTTAASKDDASAVWNAYLAQTTNDGASFAQSLVSNTPNHVGVICTGGISCADGTRNLLDLFEVAINPQNGRAAVIYVDDTLTTDSAGNPLPQLVLAQQN
ncbi:MAG: sialidase family protein [Bacteroidota bacterium]